MKWKVLFVVAVAIVAGLLLKRQERVASIDWTPTDLCDRRAIHFAAVWGSPDDCVEVAEAQIVDLKVWPENIEVTVGQSIQFYSATLDVVGRSWCEEPPSAPDAIYESGSFAGGCDSAVVMLDVSLLPDDLATMFRWATVDATPYDSLFYHILIRTGDSTTFIDDIPVKHPTDSLVWLFGVPDNFYEVQAYANGWLRGQSAGGQPGPWTRFQYPLSVPLPLDMGPITVDTVGA